MSRPSIPVTSAPPGGAAAARCVYQLAATPRAPVDYSRRRPADQAVRSEGEFPGYGTPERPRCEVKGKPCAASEITASPSPRARLTSGRGDVDERHPQEALQLTLRASAGRAAEPRSTVGSTNGLSVRYFQYGIFSAHPNRMST